MRFSKTLIPACAAIACSGATAAPNQQAVYSAVDPVYSILKKPLQAIATSLCSSYLGYPRSTSVTVTAAAATVTVTSNLPPPTVTLQATQTNTITNTGTITITETPSPVTITTTVTGDPVTRYAKRGNEDRGALHPALRGFPACKISAACSCIVQPTTKTIVVTAPNKSTATITATLAAAYSVTITQTIIDTLTASATVTSHANAEPATVTVSQTFTPVIIRPKICNARGLPGPNAFNYNANFNSNQAGCIASCKVDTRCLSTGFYIVTDPGSGTQTGTCRFYDKSVTDSDDLGFGYYNFNDKAC